MKAILACDCRVYAFSAVSPAKAKGYVEENSVGTRSMARNGKLDAAAACAGHHETNKPYWNNANAPAKRRSECGPR